MCSLKESSSYLFICLVCGRNGAGDKERRSAYSVIRAISLSLSLSLSLFPVYDCNTLLPMNISLNIRNISFDCVIFIQLKTISSRSYRLQSPFTFRSISSFVITDTLAVIVKLFSAFERTAGWSIDKDTEWWRKPVHLEKTHAVSVPCEKHNAKKQLIEFCFF